MTKNEGEAASQLIHSRRGQAAPLADFATQVLVNLYTACWFCENWIRRFSLSHMQGLDVSAFVHRHLLQPQVSSDYSGWPFVVRELSGSRANLRGRSPPPRKIAFNVGHQFDLSLHRTWLPLSARHKMLMSYNGPNQSAECSYLRITKQHKEHGVGMWGGASPVVPSQIHSAALPVSALPTVRAFKGRYPIIIASTTEMQFFAILPPRLNIQLVECCKKK